MIVIVVNNNLGKSVQSYFTNDVFPQQHNHGIDLSSLNNSDIFVPVLPLFDHSAESSSSSDSNSNSPPPTKIPPVFFTSFLGEQIRSFEEKTKDLAKIFPVNDKLITLIAAKIVVTLTHVTQVSEAYSEGVDYIEGLLQKQLISAIGKTVTPTDFAEYLTFHNRKIYREDYRPKAFSYAIRRPDHYPEVPFLSFFFL